MAKQSFAPEGVVTPSPPSAPAAASPAASGSPADFANRAQIAAALVARVRAGEPGAEEELVQRYSRGLGFLLRELTRDPAWAEDLHQETFRLVVEKLRAGQLREPEKLPGFLRSVARNLFLADCRRRSKQQHEAIDEAEPPADPREGALEQMLRREDASLVRRLLADLQPPRYRELLTRFYLAGETKERLCSEFDLSGLHFNRVIFRARQRFKEMVEAAALRSSSGQSH